VIEPWPGGEVRDDVPVPGGITCWEFFPVCWPELKTTGFEDT